MISLAIPTYNSAEFALRSFEQVLQDERITEIVICDDASADFAALAEQIHQLNSPKIKLYHNNTNLKAFRNKNKVVSLCGCEWVILLDSDNIIDPSYIDAWLQEQPWDPQTLYLPDFAKPWFDYRLLSGQRLGIEDVALLFMTEPPPLPAGINGNLWGCLFNGGNFAFHRDHYLSTHAKHVQIQALVPEPYGVDVWNFIILWLKRGFMLKIVPGMTYQHTLRPSSWSSVLVDQKNQAGNQLGEILLDSSIVIT
ncbi:MAG: glycosyltransferase [Thermostichales cyanobacterium BF4_bins_65]